MDDDVEEVETPRRERVEAVVIPACTKKWKPTGLEEQEKRPQQVLDKETVHMNLSSSVMEDSVAATTFATATTTTTMATVSDVQMEIPSDTELPQEDRTGDRRGPVGDGHDLKESFLFEDLSLSPPPPPMIFDGEEDALDESSAEPRWMMTFDSEQQSEQDGPRLIIPDLAHTDLEDDDHGEEHDRPTVSDTWGQNKDQKGGDNDDVEEDDDPFGFSKVERQLQRTRNVRPKLLAINEVHHRPITTAVSSKSSNNSSKNTDHGSVSVSDKDFRERLDQSVLARAASRRRGDGKGKGKAIHRESSSSSSHLGHEADRSQSNTTTDPMDEDLQTAIRLSRGLDMETGEGSSSLQKQSIVPSLNDPNVAKDTTMDDVLDFSPEPAPRDVDEEEPLTRNNRRISRQYGRVAPIDVNVDADASIATKTQGTSQTTTTGNATRTQDRQPSGQVEIENDSFEPDEAHRLSSPPRSPSPTRKVPDHKRLSSGSDGLPFISIETTPKKKPEAGMPLSMELSPPSSPSFATSAKRKGRMSKNSHKQLLTEQLEAMLPQRRFKREPLGSKNKRVGRTKGRKDVVAIESSDEESDEDEDHYREVHGNKGKKKGATEARHQDRLASKKKPSQSILSSSSVRDTARSGKKRRAPADVEPYTPTSKRGHVQKSTAADSSSKSKEKHQVDTSGWSASQVAAQKERIKYFQLVDDFELEVEAV